MTVGNHNAKDKMPFRFTRKRKMTHAVFNRKFGKKARVTAVGKYFPRSRGTRQEIKTVDLAPANYACDTTGTVTALNLMEAGADYNNRVGRRIAMKSLYLRGQFVAEGSPANQSYCRIIIVYDAQPNGSLPAWSDVVLSQTQVVGTTSSTVFDQINLNNRDRFKIVADITRVMPYTNNGGTAIGPDAPHAKEQEVLEYRKLGGLETIYKNSSSPGVIGDISSGSLIMLTFGNQPSPDGWSFSGSVRVRFQDN